MVMGKSHQNKCLEDFVFLSHAPCYTASNLSALYRNSALKEKDRAADLIQIGDWCEELNKDLLSIGNFFCMCVYYSTNRSLNNAIFSSQVLEYRDFCSNKFFYATS